MTKRSLLALPALLFAATLSASPLHQINIAVGDDTKYRIDDSYQSGNLGILIQKDGGAWENKNFIRHLPKSKFLESSGAYCQANNCIVTVDNLDNDSAWLIVSDDYGDNWTYVAKVAGMSKGEISNLGKAACSDKACSVFGEVFDPQGRPVIIGASKDNLYNWRKLDIQNTPTNLDYSKVTNSICSGDFCIAVGWGTNGNEYTLPVVITSRNGGESWSYDTNFTNLDKYRNTQLEDVTCRENFCIAVGSFVTDPAQFPDKPLILTSHDKGISWNKVDADVDEFRSTSLENVVMNKDQIVILMSDLTYPYQSGMLFSNDMGKTWKSFIVSRNQILNGASCTDDYCVVVGGDDDNKYNILVGSKNSGWKRVKAVDNEPANIRDAFLQKVNCQGSSCNIVGQYYVGTSMKKYPMLLTSSDKGLNWNNVPVHTPVKMLNFIADNS